MAWRTQNQSHLLVARARVEVSMRTADSLPWRTQAGGIQRTGCKNGLRLRQAAGKGVPMHCSHKEWPVSMFWGSSASAALLQRASEGVEAPSGISDAQARSCPQTLTPHTSVTPHCTELRQQSIAKSWRLQNLSTGLMWISFPRYGFTFSSSLEVD